MSTILCGKTKHNQNQPTNQPTNKQTNRPHNHARKEFLPIHASVCILYQVTRKLKSMKSFLGYFMLALFAIVEWLCPYLPSWFAHTPHFSPSSSLFSSGNLRAADMWAGPTPEFISSAQSHGIRLIACRRRPILALLLTCLTSHHPLGPSILLQKDTHSLVVFILSPFPSLC